MKQDEHAVAVKETSNAKTKQPSNAKKSNFNRKTGKGTNYRPGTPTTRPGKIPEVAYGHQKNK